MTMLKKTVPHLLSTAKASRWGALATLGLLAASAPATLIYSDPADIACPADTDGVYLNVMTGITGTGPSGSLVDGWDVHVYKSLNNATGNLRFSAQNGGGYVGASLNSPLNLPVGYEIGSGPLENGWSYYGGNTLTAAFHQSGTEVAGFRFLNENTGLINYGWIELTTTVGSGFPATINRWAYDDSGASVFAGIGPTPAPEPASLVALGAGALALVRHRRK